jgi:hypothetical protein
MQRGLILAVWIGRSFSCETSSWGKCEQVMQISQALGRTECEYKRDFYDCLRTAGCYFSIAGCKKPDGSATSCSALCESEAIFNDCRDSTERMKPEEDFHLCPHISKASQQSPPPTVEDFLGSPSIPYTFTIWTQWIRTKNSAVVSNVIPSLWKPALRATFASIFGLNPFATNVETPVAHRDYPIAFEKTLRQPPAETEETTFMVVHSHVLDEANVPAVQSMLDVGMVNVDSSGALPRNVTAFEKELRKVLNASLPSGSQLQLDNCWLVVIGGRIDKFPVITTTTSTSTTLSVDPFLILQEYRSWRVRCRGGVIHRWQIDELEMYADACPEEGVERLSPLDKNSAFGIVTSGDFANPCCSARNAFDGSARTDFDDGTSWMSSCRSCEPGTAALGLYGGRGKFRIACVVVKQGVVASNQCEDIVIEATNNLNSTAWNLRGEMRGFSMIKSLCIPRTRDDFPALECGVLDDRCRGLIDFGSCPGYQEVCMNNRCQCSAPATYANVRFRFHECGVDSDGCNGTLSFGTCTGWNQSCVANRCQDNAFRASMWRITCEAGTVGRWWVRELEFHLTGLCDTRVEQYKRLISSGAAYTSHPPASAFDGNAETFFVSQCFYCKSREAWIGIDFGRQITIPCVKIVQHESTMKRCPRLILEYSDDSSKWVERARYGFGPYSLRATEKLTPDIDATKSDSELRPPKRMAQFWRISCMETLQHQWGIYEVDFYDEIQCGRSLKHGVKKIVHSRSGDWPVENAFDSNTDTIWKSGCGLTPENYCRKGAAYIGMEFRTLVRVNCVKIHQFEAGDGDCKTIFLQFSTTGGLSAGEWLIRDKFENVGRFQYLVPYGGIPDEVDAAMPWSGLCIALLCSTLVPVLQAP